MIKTAIKKVVEGDDLTTEEAQEVMDLIMEGNATDAQIAALLTALRLKGETIDEITGFARCMRSKAIAVKPKAEFLVDTCGTGGDGADTFNISTTTAFVVAGAGVKVAKHGNRSVSSHCGSADVLEALGISIDLGPDMVANCIDQVGIGFLFAPQLHLAMKHVMPVRKETGIRTVFNILGPLTNPAGASAQVVGVYSDELTMIIAEVLVNLGTEHALVVHGANGLDEVSNTGRSIISEVTQKELKTYSVSPEDLGMRKAQLYEIKGGSAEENARILKDVLKGKNGAKRDIVLLNTAAALIAADQASGWAEGIEKAVRSIDGGNAMRRLDELISYTKACKR